MATIANVTIAASTTQSATDKMVIVNQSLMTFLRQLRLREKLLLANNSTGKTNYGRNEKIESNNC